MHYSWGVPVKIKKDAVREKEPFMSLDPTESLKVYVRWMIRRDMPEVLAIEQDSFEFPWCEEDFIRCLRQRNCIGMVAEHDDKVIGFMIYELHKSRIHVFNFAVAQDARRRRVGTRMVQKLVQKLSAQHRTRIMLEIRESNLPGTLFFRAVGFQAISILRNFYEDTTDDAYLMQYQHREEEEAGSSYPLNRITRLVG